MARRKATLIKDVCDLKKGTIVDILFNIIHTSDDFIKQYGKIYCVVRHKKQDYSISVDCLTFNEK